jgi:hypothetical protein
MSGSTLSHGKDSNDVTQPIRIGSHGDQFPEPVDFCNAGDASYTAPTGKFIKYLYGHGSAGAVCTLDIEGIGSTVGITVIGLYPTRANSVTWTSNGDITVY